MANPTLTRSLLRQSYNRIHNIRPFSTTQQHLAPEPQRSSPSSVSSPTFASARNPNPPPVESMQGLIHSATRRKPALPDRPSAVAATASAYRAADLAAHLNRRFLPGDVYAPHDLSPVEQEKFRFKRANHRDTPSLPSAKSKRSDAFDVLNIHPLAEYANFSMMSEFCTGMGRLKGRRETGLRGVNQRRISKAVRRSVGMGLCPSVHRHPEMLEKEKMDLTRKRMNAADFRGGRPKRFG
ncbi:MAG: hypothetical protein Q9207_008572 [Kuettlingeria erythrocarpa]